MGVSYELTDGQREENLQFKGMFLHEPAACPKPGLSFDKAMRVLAGTAAFATLLVAVSAWFNKCPVMRWQFVLQLLLGPFIAVIPQVGWQCQS